MADDSPLPRWLTYNPNNRIISGTGPTNISFYDLLIIANDGFNLPVFDTLQLKFVNKPPILNNSISQSNSFEVGKSFSIDIPSDLFVDPDGDDLIWKAYY